MGDETKSGAEDQAAQGSEEQATPETEQTTEGGDHVEGDKVINEAPAES